MLQRVFIVTKKSGDIMAKNHVAVWFHRDEVESYKKSGFSQPFNDFVKNAYYEKKDLNSFTKKSEGDSNVSRD